MIGYEMRNFEKKKIPSVTRERCLESCLLASDFECRSVNYNNVTGDCSLSTVDRHALPTTNLKAHFAPAGNQHLDYYESNCIQGKCDGAKKVFLGGIASNMISEKRDGTVLICLFGERSVPPFE